MLTRLFNNLSLPSLIYALVVSFLLTAIAVVFQDHKAGILALPGFTLTVSGAWYEIALLIFLPFASLWFNSLLISSGFLKSHFYALPLLTLQLYIFSLHQTRPEVLLALPFFLMIFGRLLRLVTGNPLFIALDIGLLIGVMTLFYPQGVLSILFAWIALLIFGQLSFRTLLIPLVGMLTVYFLLYSAFYFFSDYPFIEYLWKSFSGMEFGWKGILLERFSLYLPIALVLIPALGEYIKAINYANIKKRQILNLMAILLIVTFFAGSFVRNREAVYFFLAFPLSILQANLIQYLKKWWMQDLVYVAVLLSFLLIVFLS